MQQFHDDHIRLKGGRYVFYFLEDPDRSFNAEELRKFVNKKAPAMPELWRANMDRIIGILEHLDEKNRPLSLKDLIA